ncbi:killer cell lectin-like receptor subfamily F member 1 isoform X2 [Pleurodeles waltl]|uniref:killer cell lectin-like receptor subfamily F member 1 isoform X2 n=1 Tax=Pleurodeles waltl TaxID=8319 RepID=UPI003709C1B9
MADVTYVDVRFSKKESASLTSEECPEAPAMPPVCNFLTKALGGLVVLLLAVVIALLIFILRCYTQIPLKTEIPSASDANRTLEICFNSGFIFEKTSLTMEGLKGYLCKDLNESICVMCPYNWMVFREGCYFISEELKSWTSSEEYCVSRQSHLLLIDDEEEMNFIEAKGTSKSFFWIGLQINGSRPEWTWLNGSTLQKDRIPTNIGEAVSSCASYNKKKMYSVKCNDTHKWICEKKAIQFSKRSFDSNQLSKDQF